MEEKAIWVVGGDERMAALSRLLEEDGYRVYRYGLERRIPCCETLEGLERARGVILPLPADDGAGRLRLPLSDLELTAAEVLDRLGPDQLLLAGKASPALRAQAGERGLVLRDYFAGEELARLNAIPTAEGAIRMAMEALPVTIHDAEILLLGFGRLGQALGPRLRALGGRVFAAARRGEQRAQAREMGLDSGSLSAAGELGRFDLVINTVPAAVLGEEKLSQMRQDALIIDLASLPGGVDDAAAVRLGRRVIHALALPGREAPLTAARYLYGAVRPMLEE